MLEKALTLFSHTALGGKENLLWSGMDLRNVIQMNLQKRSIGFFIVRLNLGDTKPKLGYTC